MPACLRILRSPIRYLTIHYDRTFYGENCLVHLYPVTHHPQFKLLKPGLPVCLEALHPLAVGLGIGNINNNFYEIVAVHDAADTPVPLDFLRFVAGGAKMVDDFQDCFGQPLRRYVAPSLNWRGSKTSYRRHLLLIRRFALDGKWNVLLSEGFQSSLRHKMFAGLKHVARESAD